MYIHVYKYSKMYVCVHKFQEMYERVCTAYMIRTYYSIVHTYHIRRTDTYVHVYAMCIGFQMFKELIIELLVAVDPRVTRG